MGWPQCCGQPFLHSRGGVSFLLQYPLTAPVLQYPSSYDLKACILRCKTMGFASQYAGFCSPICMVLQRNALFA